MSRRLLSLPERQASCGRTLCLYVLCIRGRKEWDEW